MRLPSHPLPALGWRDQKSLAEELRARAAAAAADYAAAAQVEANAAAAARAAKHTADLAEVAAAAAKHTADLAEAAAAAAEQAAAEESDEFCTAQAGAAASQVDDAGVPVVLALVVPHAGMTLLLTLLTASKACHAAVTRDVEDRMESLDFDTHRGRNEFPLDSEANGAFRPLHYEHSLLSYAEHTESRITAALDGIRAAHKAKWNANPPRSSFRVAWSDDEEAYIFASMGGVETALRAADSKRVAMTLTPSQRVLLTTSPPLARVLPCKWPLRYIAGLVKLAASSNRGSSGRRVVGADTVARAFHEVVAPPKFYEARGTLSAAELALVRQAVSNGLTLAHARRVMKSTLRWDERLQAYHVRDKYAPLVKMKAGQQLCALARRAMTVMLNPGLKRVKTAASEVSSAGNTGKLKVQRTMLEAFIGGRSGDWVP